MLTISFCSPKGGSGKSTTCAVLALELARTGWNVKVMDTDPKNWLTSWALLKPLPKGLQVYAVPQDQLTDAAESLSYQADFLLIDIEGSDDASLIDAILVSDMVISPCRSSRMDASGSVQVLKQVRQKSRMLKRPILSSVLMTQTAPGAIEHRITGEIKAILKEAGAPILRTQFANRPIFQAMVSLGGDFIDLPKEFQGSSPTSAIENARALAVEVVDRLSGVPLPKVEQSA
ncbi:ParA family protein [Shimia thalassica]|uniref:ParA family protein n=1 Tax=Shimia thalassica TaxID=1715693 RepID=UPI0026E29955|nr:ParA family protein [Shimia thalassica]MDO6481415.1 ParA family protein [Shimia thalassica]